MEKISGLLVGTLGLEREVAVTIAGLIASGGLTYAALAYPIIAPFIGTLQGVIAVLGTSAVVGF